MRSHLYVMLERNTLIHFPTLKNESPNKHLLSSNALPIILNQNKVSILKKAVYNNSYKLTNDENATDENSLATPAVSTNEKFPLNTKNDKELRSFWSVNELPNPDIQCYANASFQTYCIVLLLDRNYLKTQNKMPYTLRYKDMFPGARLI